MNKLTPTKVVRVKVSDDIRQGLLLALDELGGIEKFVQPGEKVLLKPNLNTADPFPASSDPEFIRALCSVLLDAGAQLTIVESSMFKLKTRDVAKKNGLSSVAVDLGVTMTFLDEDEWVPKLIPNAKFVHKVHVGKALCDAGKLVLAPCLKTHRFARFTGAMKLFVGAIRNRDRLKMHMRRLEEKIPEVASLFSPTLVIMDARKVFVTGGPMNGDVESPGYLLVGTNMLAVDVVGVKILQEYKAKNRLDFSVWELPQIRRAVELEIGPTSDEMIEIINIRA